MNHDQRLLEEYIRETIRENKIDEGIASSIGHAALDAVGMIPGFGEAADITNALWYAKQGDWLFAALSLISVIPVIGDAIGKGGKVAALLGKLGKTGAAVGKGAQEASKLAKLVVANKETIKKSLKALRASEKLAGVFGGKEDSDETKESKKNEFFTKIEEELNKFVSDNSSEAGSKEQSGTASEKSESRIRAGRTVNRSAKRDRVINELIEEMAQNRKRRSRSSIRYVL